MKKQKTPHTLTICLQQVAASPGPHLVSEAAAPLAKMAHKTVAKRIGVVKRASIVVDT